MASYTKLRDGTWGVRVEGKPSIGATIQVKTKAGEMKTETIKAVLFTGPDKYSGGVSSLCAVHASPRSQSRRSRSRGAQYCEGWGADNPHPPKPPYTCTQCGDD